VSKRIKRILYPALLGLYVSGVAVWVMQTFMQRDHGFGLQAPPQTLDILHIHSIIGLWFLLVFGYLFRAHIETGWRSKMKRRSGVLLTAPFLILFATVPGLFYLVDEKWKSTTSFIHTYLGLILVVPFFIHYFTKKRQVL
jgi:hypothetical protein